MLNADAVIAAIPNAFGKYEVPGDLPHGRVRDFYVTADGKHRILISTDRMNVFDQQVGLIPYKGQVLNELSTWWFHRIGDTVRHHFVTMPDPNVMLVRESKPIPVEVVVRSYITGTTRTSLWARYAAGEREIYGIKFADGLKKNQALPEPIVTAKTKFTGNHDERTPISDIVKGKYLSDEVWDRIRAIALDVYRQGQEVAAKGGLILADTKYEFGTDEETGDLLLIDEIHTPDSSRIWEADTYEDRMEADAEPESFDRELVRLWYVSRENPDAPKGIHMDRALVTTVSQRYQQVYERFTGEAFAPASYPAQPRVEAAVAVFA